MLTVCLLGAGAVAIAVPALMKRRRETKLLASRRRELEAKITEADRIRAENGLPALPITIPVTVRVQVTVRR